MRGLEQRLQRLESQRSASRRATGPVFMMVRAGDPIPEGKPGDLPCFVMVLPDGAELPAGQEVLGADDQRP